MMEFSKIFKYGYEVDWEYVESIPEFAALKTCKQSLKWHGEGSAWEHTKECVEAAYIVHEANLLGTKDVFDDMEMRIAVAAVLFHDIGKGVTTDYFKGDWHSYNHEYESEKIARRLLWNSSPSIRETICACARYHMKALKVADSKRVIDEMISLSKVKFMSLWHLIFVKLCDIMGSLPMDMEQRELDMRKMRGLYIIAEMIGVLDDQLVLPRVPHMMVYPPVCGKEPKSTVFVMVGLPGAGKNTYIEKNKRPFDEVVSRDDIRAELGYCNEGDKVVLPKEQEDEVTKIFDSRLVQYVKEGKDVWINNINIKRKYRDALKALLKGYPVEWVYVYVEAPTIEDNERRRPTFQEGVIRSMIETLDWPQPEEFDEFIVSKEW